MIELQYLTLATVVAILGLNIQTIEVDASIVDNRTNIAQKSSEQKKSSTSEDLEMIETIQKRDKKVQGFKDILKIDGVVPEVVDGGKSADTGDDMMNAIQKRQDKVKNLKELKLLKDKFNREKIAELKKEDINLENVEEFEELQLIINDESLGSDKILKTLQKKNINIESVDKLQKIKKIINTGKPKSSSFKTDDSGKLSAKTAFRMFTIGIPATILVFFIATPFVKVTFRLVKDNVDEKFGNPKVPDGSITLHNKALKEITSIGTKAEKVNDDKFGGKEFKLLLQIKIDIAKETAGYKKLSYGVELLVRIQVSGIKEGCSLNPA